MAALRMGDGLNNLSFRCDEILDKIKENREKHIKEFEESKKNFLIVIVGAAKEMLEKVSALTMDKSNFGSFSQDLSVPVPHSNVEDYDRVIDMLTRATDEEINLDQTLFEQLIQDKWAWSRSHRFSNESLAASARKYS